MVTFIPPATREDLIIQDRVYGEIIFHASSDALLIDLIASPSFQRLKGVLQHGISSMVGPLATEDPVTRFEHSVGACTLLRRLGADMEESAAALLHDVAHTALSHVVDRVWGHVVHEDDKHIFLALFPDISAIIEAHGFSSERVLEESNFSLLERDSPLLCGDRLDYALRDCRHFGLLSEEDCQRILAQLCTHNGEICCTDAAAARLLSEAYMAADTLAWSNPVHGALYEFTADAIREAYEAGDLDMQALWKFPDREFWSNLVHSPRDSVRQKAAAVRPLTAVQVQPGDDPPVEEGTTVLTLDLRVRTLDPTVVLGNGREVKRLSGLDEEYGRKVEGYKKGKQGARRYIIRYE